MNAVVAPVPTPAKLQQLKDSLLRQTRRSGRGAGSFRCRCCGSRVEVELRFDEYDKEIGSTGRCRTPNCIAWEE